MMGTMTKHHFDSDSQRDLYHLHHPQGQAEHITALMSSAVRQYSWRPDRYTAQNLLLATGHWTL